MYRVGSGHVRPHRPAGAVVNTTIACASVIGGSEQLPARSPQHFADRELPVCPVKTVQQSELAFRTQLVHRSVVVVKATPRSDAVQIAFRVLSHAGVGSTAVRRGAGKVVQDGLLALVEKLPIRFEIACFKV